MKYIKNLHNKKIKKLNTVYIGYDPIEHRAVNVLIDSILEHASSPLNIITLNQNALRRSGMYRRAHIIDEKNKKQMIDVFDKKPLSTEFSFSRFLVPALNQYEGHAIFMDCDMYIKSDICEIFEKYCNDDSKPIMCVKHNYNPVDKIKMYGVKQEQYNMKNWSSFILWNCSHPANLNLTVDDVNTKPGSWLHQFSWLDSDSIGELPHEWNWLDGHSSEELIPKNVHFTTGGPWFDGWTPSRHIDKVYSDEWRILDEKLNK